MLKRLFYRFAHRHGWHHVTTTMTDDGDIANVCEWCGLREEIKFDPSLGLEHFKKLLFRDPTVATEFGDLAK